MVCANFGFVALAHVPEKWTPVFRQEHAQLKEARAHPDSTQSGCALGWNRRFGGRRCCARRPLRGYPGQMGARPPQHPDDARRDRFEELERHHGSAAAQEVEPDAIDLEGDGGLSRRAGQGMRSAVHERELARHPARTIDREGRGSRRRREIHRQGAPHDEKAAARRLTLGIDELAAREVVALERLEKFPQLRGPEGLEERKRRQRLLGERRR
jgi:hypothetical protein